MTPTPPLTQTPPVAYPKLPETVFASGGDVIIVLKPRIKHGTEELWGSWEESTRVVEIDSTASPRHQWRTFYHELTHVALTDSGADELLTDGTTEMICDAISTARMRERFG